MPRTALAPALVLLAACSAPPAQPADSPAPSPAADQPIVATAPSWDLGWAEDAVFYEVFVRSFADSDGDGIGDFAGLTARLDYLNDGDPATDDDLGVDALWLMPVFESPSYHGYDVVDYRAIDREYGGDDAFDAFLAAAHQRGVRVIVDLMVNHTSSHHPWFVDSANGPGAAHRDWYLWRDDDPGWTQPWGDGPVWHRNPAGDGYYYGIFWSGMPDLDFANPAVRDEVKRIAFDWLDRGVDGFRLDAARHIDFDGPGELQNDTPETHAWWAEFAAAVRERDPSALLVGENWTDAEQIAPYFAELPMNFNFPLAEAIVAAVRRDDAGAVAAALEETARRYPDGSLPANFLTNHDMTRIATQVGGGERKLRTAAALLLTLPGVPFVYYGEEIGMKNGPGGADEWKRTPMPWTADGGFSTAEPWYEYAPGRERANVAAEDAEPGSLLDRYRRLIRLRKGEPALARGSIELLTGPEPGKLLAYVRRQGDERLLVAHNLGGGAVAETVAVAAGGAEPVWGDDGAAAAADGDGWRLSLPAGASGVWRLDVR